jgi:hypothetical protein
MELRDYPQRYPQISVDIVRHPPGSARKGLRPALAIDPFGGGWVFDRFGGCAWLYIGSFVLGMGAVAIALAFRPITKRPLACAGQVQAGGA